MIDLKVTHAPQDIVPILWTDFTKAIGEASLVGAYGTHWPRPIVDGEEVYMFRQGDELVGWGSLIYDPTELVTWHIHGVFPEFQEQGITKYISRILRSLAFTETPCIAVCCKILDTNPKYQKWMKERNPNKGWVYAGHILLPLPGYDVYSFSREYWEKEERNK